RSRGSMSAFTALPLTVNARGMDTGPPLLWAPRFVSGRAEGKDTASRKSTQSVVGGARRRAKLSFAASQVRDVLRQALDVRVGQRTGDARHVAGVVRALARLEIGELLLDVRVMLAGDA